MYSLFLQRFSRRMLIAAVVVTSLRVASGLHCLSCSGVVSPADCDSVTQCGIHEHCYIDTVTTSVGNIKYNLGCRDKQQCESPLRTGRREASVDYSKETENESAPNVTAASEVKKNQNQTIQHALNKRFSELLICSKCCSSDLCNNIGCGSKGYAAPRGPVCFTCLHQTTPQSCSKVKVCRQDEVCKLLKTLNPLTRDTRYVSTCEKEMKCNADIQTYRQMYTLANSQRRRRDSVSIAGSCHIQCCKTDLCNNECSGMTTTAVFPISTLTTTLIASAVTSQIPLNPAFNISVFPSTNLHLPTATSTSKSTTASTLEVTTTSTSKLTIASTSKSTAVLPSKSTIKPISNSTTAFISNSAAVSTESTSTEQSTLWNEPCLSNPCMRGRCDIYQSTYRCTCTNGFWGRNCDKAIDFCDPNPCLYGTCTNHLGAFICKCDNGYMGTKCDKPTNSCSSNPCKNGVCVNGLGNYSCICREGFSGKNCEHNVCWASQCSNKDNCTAVSDGYSYLCLYSWTGEHCTDIVCPAGWEGYKESCYFFDQSGGKSFYDALNFCHYKGGTLLEVSDAETNDFVKRMLTVRNKYEYWLGLTDIQTEGQYTWIDSKKRAHFYDWAPAEPDDTTAKDEEDCVVYSSQVYHPNMQWADVKCSRADAFAICKKRKS